MTGAVGHVQIIGDKELMAKLKRLGDDVAGRALEDSLAAGALEIVNQAKRICPYRTGNLRRSIHVGGHTGLTPEMGSATASDLAEVKTKTGKHFAHRRYVGSKGTDLGGNHHTRDSAEVQVGTNVEYASVVEYGTAKRAAKPYLRPAVDTKTEAAGRTTNYVLGFLIAKATR